MNLESYSSRGFDRGRAAVVEALWLIAQALFVSSWIPGAWHRIVILRAFGASIGFGVVIKPRVQIKFPWRLTIGNNSWIGEQVSLDNLERIDIGSDCCISQRAYLCTGNHDWNTRGFDLITRPIKVCDKAWIGAQSVVGPGVTVGEGAVLTLGGVATQDLVPWQIHRGNPAMPIKLRKITEK